MSIVAGVDFGTLSVRVSVFDRDLGRLGAGVASYPLKRSKDNPHQVTQSHFDQMAALEIAVREAVVASGIDGHAVAALAIDTTGSSVIPVDAKLRPLDDYYLWCDHRAWHEAQEITDRFARSSGSVPFLFFAAMMVLDFFIILFYYPETAGVSLEKMQHVVGVD